MKTSLNEENEIKSPLLSKLGETRTIWPIVSLLPRSYIRLYIMCVPFKLVAHEPMN